MTACATPGCPLPIRYRTKTLCRVCYAREQYRRICEGRPEPPRRRVRPHKRCSVEGCSNVAQCRGWCKRHYCHLWRQGLPPTPQPDRYGDEPPPRVRAEILERIAQEHERKVTAMAARGDGGAPRWEPRVYRVRTARRR